MPYSKAIFQSVSRLIIRAVLLVFAGVFPVAAQSCSEPLNPAFYSKGDYRVRRVRIESPISFLHTVRRNLDVTRERLPLQPGGVFSADDLNAGSSLIRERAGAMELDDDKLFRVLVVVARIENCQEQQEPRGLDVVYQVFSSDFNPYLSHTIELKQEEIERPAATAATSNSTGFLSLRPHIGYNHTRRLYGGARLSMRTPGGIFDTFHLAASGNALGNVEELEFAKTIGTNRGALDHLEYRFGYSHVDLPAGENRLRKGTFYAQLFASTRPLGKQKVVMRFGVSLEGGNRQTDLAEAKTSGIDLASSGYGGLKTYIGATTRFSRHSFAGAYGVQAGTRGARASVDFIKHLVDFGAALRFLPKEELVGKVHKPVDVELQLTGGAIHRLGKLPVAERFFGGNVPQDFIAGDSWRIRGGPLIRSFPQNRLLGSGSSALIGGTAFYAFNLTVSRPVWGKPLIPKELGEDPEFLPALNFERESAEQVLIATYTKDLPAFKALVEHLAPLETDFNRTASLLDDLQAAVPEEIRPNVEAAREETLEAIGLLQLVRTEQPMSLRSLIKGPVSRTTKVVRSLTALADSLETAHLPARSAQVRTLTETIRTRQTALVGELDGLNLNAAESRAREDMQTVDRVLASFLREWNLVSISPVAVFDIARIWPDKYGTRYGIGGGVRLSVANFNVTVGYSFNPDPKPREGRGALFFSMDVTELFR
ncbi:MAG: hypothetical protein ACREEM_05895 [Blastocatellia bacterium]